MNHACHYLSPVEDEDCWSLFEKRAFGLIDPIVYPKLHGIWKHIVNKCKGLPLVVKTVAGLLHLKLDVEEWEEVLTSDIWRFSLVASLPNDILPALRLSYNLQMLLSGCAYLNELPEELGKLINLLQHDIRDTTRLIKENAIQNN